jgi:hypothetical protein
VDAERRTDKEAAAVALAGNVVRGGTLAMDRSRETAAVAALVEAEQRWCSEELEPWEGDPQPSCWCLWSSSSSSALKNVFLGLAAPGSEWKHQF